MKTARVFKDVPFARTGIQKYLEGEVTKGGSYSTFVDVYRGVNQVRNSAKSFNFVPLTNDHPSEFVTPETFDNHAVGVVSGVYFDEQTYQLKGNFLIWDESAIADIDSGKRQLSGGYQCDVSKQSASRYLQSAINGNHVALCHEGRSGKEQSL